MVAACMCAALTTTGCSLLVDTDPFSGSSDDASVRGDGGAGPDASTTDGGPPSDANPLALSVTGVLPDTVLEGEGATSAGYPVPVIIAGANISPTAVVTASHPSVTVVDTLVGADGKTLAVTLRIPVLPGTAAGAMLPLTLTVTQSGISDTAALNIEGLAELDIPAGDYVPDGQTYSSIVVSGAAQLRGNVPARLISTSDIEINADLSADSDDISVPGPGACSGGAAEKPGGCDQNGGGAAGASGLTVGTGGGGAGCGTPGQPGESDGGVAGAATCEQLVRRFGTENRGAGGGGGGNSLAGTGGGGTGGAGGGSVELHAGGTIRINGNLTAAGSDGAAGTGIQCSDHGAGGGGGSGGIIVLRAAAIERITGTITAKGGNGGGAAACVAGGGGGLGRIRLDAPLTLGPVGGDDPFAQGPFIAAAMPSLSKDVPITVKLVGQADTTFLITTDGGDVKVLTTDATGVVTTDLDLEPGVHSVCTSTVPIGGAWENCRKIAIVP